MDAFKGAGAITDGHEVQEALGETMRADPGRVTALAVTMRDDFQ